VADAAGVGVGAGVGAVAVCACDRAHRLMLAAIKKRAQAARREGLNIIF